jgi:uncharacterized protein YcsI (UPF0317 family)
MNAPVAQHALRATYRTAADVRRAIRAGAITGQTSGLADAYVQANLVILPQTEASDFLRFATLNPKPCPVIGLSEPGSPRIPSLGADLDLRTDLPRYRVWQNGELVDEPADITRWWRDDLVAFAIGCSFSFEWALMADGLEIGHITRGTNVPMYRTNIACTPAGAFSGPLVVTMRAFRPKDAIRAIQISSRFPAVHGAPVHIGHPQMIGISDLAKPDYGDPVDMPQDTLPVFWACGVTPQAVIAAARPPFAITHAPGAMLVTDLLNSGLSTM